MTGQVKEDIICRFGELGVKIEAGSIHFQPDILRSSEFIWSKKTFRYFNIEEKEKSVDLSDGSLAFTLCQVPIVYTISDKDYVVINLSSGETRTTEGRSIDKDTSHSIFSRSGYVSHIQVFIQEQSLIK